MNSFRRISLSVLAAALAFAGGALQAKPLHTIRVSTAATDLILKVDSTGTLCQSYLGPAWTTAAGIEALPAGRPAYYTYGLQDHFEPAVRVTHSDGNTSLVLKYVSHTQQQVAPGITRTIVTLRDEVYPVEVKMFYETFRDENIIKVWTEISHREKKPIRLGDYASAMLHFSAPHYWLTEFTGTWGAETTMTEQELAPGKKILDTRMGARAAMYTSPFFILGLNGPALENSGDVLLGTLNWTGNFRFTFEMEPTTRFVRMVAGINPYAAEYELPAGEVFRTPEFVFTLSNNGTGAASRDFHAWARNYQLKDGHGERMTLLNNWEATGFGFDEPTLQRYIKEAADLGVDMFLLDDGWFGNKYPRHNSTQGLGDWEPTAVKLPHGVGGLVKTATEAGVKFGIWIEPEMVNPKSELFEKHPDWVIHYPNREPYYYRSQLVLDLTNPQVQDYVFGVVDKLLSENPGLAYFKWDCNSMLSNPYSYYLKEKQGNLFVDYVRGLYNVLERVKAKYPDLPMMLCSGGGGRCDYEALKYFTEFWASDNTQPIKRIYIQWGYSYFFPSKSIAAHVTSMSKQEHIKFRTDVAMMCKMGFDINLEELPPAELQFCRDAVKTYNRLSPIILEGEMFRLVSPYSGNHAAVIYRTADSSKAVLFTYDMYAQRYIERPLPVLLQGLDPQRTYKVEEINRLEGVPYKALEEDGKTFTGEYLMKVGLQTFTDLKGNSRVIEITAQ